MQMNYVVLYISLIHSLTTVTCSCLYWHLPDLHFYFKEKGIL
jgi:hypothetical protein